MGILIVAFIGAFMGGLIGRLVGGLAIQLGFLDWLLNSKYKEKLGFRINKERRPK